MTASAFELESTPEGVGLPALTPNTARRVQQGPATAFAGDGFPHRRRPDGSLVPHPILGTYLLRGYLDAYESSGRMEQLEAASVVARGALGRMQESGNFRAFWYQPEWGLSSWVGRPHYSGLTQSYYAVELARLAYFSADPDIFELAEQVMNSLMVPVPDGGVMVEQAGVLGFEEVPVQSVSLILNGWLSILVSMTQYATLTGRDRWRQIAEASLAGVERMMPLYDVERLALSRYSLLGYQYFRLRFAEDGVLLRSARVETPGSAPVEVAWGPDAQSGGRYRSWLNPKDVDESGRLSRTSRMNLALSRFSYPARNTLVVELDSARAQTCTLEVQTSTYDPFASAPVAGPWKEIAQCRLAGGVNQAHFALRWPELPLMGFPVNFRKRTPSGGSIYHGIHIKRLNSLADSYNRPLLSGWAELWTEYQDRWKDIPELAVLTEPRP